MLDKRKPHVIIAGTAHLEFHDEAFEKIKESLMVNSRAAGYSLMMVHLYQAIQYIAERGLVGDVVEFGVYKGGTAVFLARALKHFGVNATVRAFDTFTGFPQRGHVLDLYHDNHDVYTEYDEVARYCAGHRITLVPGDIRTTHESLRGVPLILSFFDTDNYSPAIAALRTSFEQTVTGGIIAFDHFCCDARWVETIGERMAAEEFFQHNSNVFHLHGTGLFLKV